MYLRSHWSILWSQVNLTMQDGQAEHTQDCSLSRSAGNL